MEKVYQSVGADGLHIPVALMRQYGLEPGAIATLELQSEWIRIEPARAEPATIENRALRYLLTHVGDAATVSVHPLPGGMGWQVDVYGTGMVWPVGKLVYSPTGVLLADQSTPPDGIRRSLDNGSSQL